MKYWNNNKRNLLICHHYDNNNMEKKLFNHLGDNTNNTAIIKYKDKTLFSDSEIVENSVNFYSDLYGNRKSLNCYPDENIQKRIDEIIDNSYNDDEKQENQEFTSDELNDAINHFKISKASGMDCINYQIYKILNINFYLHIILLRIINLIFLLSTYPDQLNIAILYLLKKRPFISHFGDFRAITITNNLKNIINYLRFKRNIKIYENNTNLNHAAYRKGIGCEIAMYGISNIINKLTLKSISCYIRSK